MTVSVEALAKAQIENYRRQPAELISHFNRERSAVNGYRGRQLLELLQNADDAGEGLESGSRLRIDLSRERLIVANTGNPFSPKGLTSLVISDCSPKQLDRNRFIGCKGLGFRAILTWTDQPLIASGPYEVVFKRSEAISRVRQLLLENREIEGTIRPFKESTNEWPAAVMRFPKIPDIDDPWMREARAWREADYDTVIVMPLGGGEKSDHIHREIRDQLSHLPASALLFCRHLTELQITGDCNKTWNWHRKVDGSVTLQHDGIDDLWQVRRREGKVSNANAHTSADGRDEYEVAVAIPQEVKPNPEGMICVFFPTRESMPCALVMHATLETTDDRNRLVDHATNRQVLRELAAFVAAVVEEQATPADPRRALDLLAGAEFADQELQRLGFLEALMTECAGRRIFPRLDSTLRSAADVRQAPNGVWLELEGVPAEHFPEIISVGPEDRLKSLMSLLNLHWYDSASLKERLTRFLGALTGTQAGEVVGQLLVNGQLASVGAAGLLRGTDGHLIQAGKCFLTPEKQLPPLPEWAVNVKFIEDEFQKGLIEGSQLPDSRHLAARLNNCRAEIEEYRFDTVARELIGEAERVDAQEDTPRLERWRHVLRWLFDASPDASQVLRSLNIKVVTVGGCLRRATDCYLGGDYPHGNVVSRLYKHFDQDEFVGPPNSCGLEGAPLSDVEEFLSLIGVKFAPNSQEFQSDPEYGCFLSTMLARMDWPRNVRDRWCNSAQELNTLCLGYRIDNLFLPDRWFKILDEGDSSAITAYLLSSDGSKLLVHDQDPQAKFMAKVHHERNFKPDPSIPIPNPALHYLRKKAWVQDADGKRHRPSEIMLSGHGVRILQGVYALHAIDASDPLITTHGGRAALEGLLTRLGAVSSLESIDGASLYDLLLSLPDRDPKGEVAPGIYRTLVESSAGGEDPPQRDSFIKKGRMWARHQGVESYLPVGQLRYNANLTVTKPIEAHIPLVRIPTRLNTAVIEKLFGIPSLTAEEIRLELRRECLVYDPRSEYANQHLRNALPYIYALRLAKTMDERCRERNLLHNAFLHVCSRANVVARLPEERTEEINLKEPGERIVVDSNLVIVGEYREHEVGSLTFWLGVAELVAELLGREVADEVGGILRCRTPAEMQEVVSVRLGADADAKLAEARIRFAELRNDPDEIGSRQIPAPKVYAPDTRTASQVEPPQGATPKRGSGGDGSDGKPTSQPLSTTTTITPLDGPANNPPRKRKLVVVCPPSGGGGARGPLATEDITFKVAEAFEEEAGRFVIPVSHLHGADGFGCDLLSVDSADVRDAALNARSVTNEDIRRRIEVKGRSSRTGEVELSENEFCAATQHRAVYWIYRVYVDPGREGCYEIALLNDPLCSNAVRTVTRFDLAQGSGATWFKMVEKVDDEATSERESNVAADQ